MEIKFFRNNPAFSSPFIAIISDFDQEFTNELNAIENNDILIIRHAGTAKAMIFFNKEQDYNWYMLKWK